MFLAAGGFSFGATSQAASATPGGFSFTQPVAASTPASGGWCSVTGSPGCSGFLLAFNYFLSST